LRRDNGKTSTIDGDSKAVSQGADGIVTTAAIGNDHNGAQEQIDPSLTGLPYGLVPDLFDFATTRFPACITVTTFPTILFLHLSRHPLPQSCPAGEMSHKVDVCRYPSLTNALGWSRVLGDESAGEMTRTERDEEGDNCHGGLLVSGIWYQSTVNGIEDRCCYHVETWTCQYMIYG